MAHRVLGTHSLRELVVGSQVHGEYSSVDRDFMSSPVSSKSYTSAFSSILEGVTDFGSGTKPYMGSVSFCSLLWYRAVTHTFCKLHLISTCASVFPYFFATFFKFGSPNLCPLTSGLYACTMTPLCLHHFTISGLVSQGWSSHWPTSMAPPLPLPYFFSRSWMYVSSSSRWCTP